MIYAFKKILDHFKHNENHLRFNPFKYWFSLSWLVLLILFSCQKEEVKPRSDLVMGYFPLKSENQWTYKVEGVNEDDQISSVSREIWKVNSDLYLDHYKVTPDGEEYIGYKVMGVQDRLEINDIIGTFVSVKYIDLPSDSLIFIASDNQSILRERWIKGGIQKIDSSIGVLDCICTKTTYHFGNLEVEYIYFCKDIGMYLIEKNYLYEDEGGNLFIGFTWRRTLKEYQID